MRDVHIILWKILWPETSVGNILKHFVFVILEIVAIYVIDHLHVISLFESIMHVVEDFKACN